MQLSAKTGEVNQATKAFELKGHTSGVHQVAFTSDTSKMATVSEDGTWKVFLIRGIILKN